MQLALQASWSGRLGDIGHSDKEGDLEAADHRVGGGHAVAKLNAGHDARWHPRGLGCARLGSSTYQSSTPVLPNRRAPGRAFVPCRKNALPAPASFTGPQRRQASFGDDIT